MPETAAAAAATESTEETLSRLNRELLHLVQEGELSRSVGLCNASNEQFSL
jgi:hypothetical protein